MYETSVYLKKLIRKSKNNHLIFFIILMISVLAVGLTMKYMVSVGVKANEPIAFDNFDSSQESVYSTLEIHALSESFASYKANSEHQFYFAFDQDGNPYVLVLDDSQFQELEPIYAYTYGDEDAIAPPPMSVNGYPVPFEDEIIELASEEFELLLGETLMSNSDFTDWFGYTYLDATIKPGQFLHMLSNVVLTVGILLSVLALFLWKKWYQCHRITEATLALPDIQSTLAKADASLAEAAHIYYRRLGILVTRDFVISYGDGFQIIPLNQIISCSLSSSHRLGEPHYLSLILTNRKEKRLATSEMEGAGRKKERELFCQDMCQRIATDSEQDVLPLDDFARLSAAAMAGDRRAGSNPVLGIVGAVLASLVGVAAWILIGRLGFVAGIAGYLIMLFALKGYRFLGGLMDRKGVVLCLLVTVTMIFFANWLGYYLVFYQAFAQNNFMHVTPVSILKEMPVLMKEYEMTGEFMLNLGIGYLLSAFSCSSYIKALWTKHEEV